MADIEAVAPLLDAHRVFQGQTSDVDAARQFLRARLDHGESVLFIAEEGAAALGFAQLYPSFSTTALARVFVLNDLFVHESGRRRGIAAALLAAVEQYAWALGAVRVTLNAARNNAPALALYQALGWTVDTQFHMHHRFAPPR